MGNKGLPLFEVFVRSKRGLDHRHVGSLHAEDHEQALEYARDVYLRRSEGVSIWVVRSEDVVASQEEDVERFYDPMEEKTYRHALEDELPDEVKICRSVPDNAIRISGMTGRVIRGEGAAPTGHL
jgi:ring-1,2-phenylacetyl-CoA epoxidase subunit PaaB